MKLKPILFLIICALIIFSCSSTKETNTTNIQPEMESLIENSNSISNQLTILGIKSGVYAYSQPFPPIVVIKFKNSSNSDFTSSIPISVIYTKDGNELCTVKDVISGPLPPGISKQIELKCDYGFTVAKNMEQQIITANIYFNNNLIKSNTFNAGEQYWIEDYNYEEIVKKEKQKLIISEQSVDSILKNIIKPFTEDGIEIECSTSNYIKGDINNDKYEDLLINYGCSSYNNGNASLGSGMVLLINQNGILKHLLTDKNYIYFYPKYMYDGFIYGTEHTFSENDGRNPSIEHNIKLKLDNNLLIKYSDE